jgi:hypothetical protein
MRPYHKREKVAFCSNGHANMLFYSKTRERIYIKNMHELGVLQVKKIVKVVE